MNLSGILTFHPAYVHFPIAFYFLEGGLLISWVACGKESHLYFSRLAFRWGYGFMLLAMLTGYLNAGRFQGLMGKVTAHFYAVSALFLYYSAKGFLGRSATLPAGWRVGASLVGCALVTVAAYYGGRLVCP
jgi:uncharacterized membrane protein